MVFARDYKRALDGDAGLNTGGMGAYSPVKMADDIVSSRVIDTIINPLVSGLQSDGITYKGILYVGLMIDHNHPSVVEFNVRFGDPETQVILPRLNTDFIDILEAISCAQLHTLSLSWSDHATCCGVIASGGYPGPYKIGHLIDGIGTDDDICCDNAFAQVIHAGTTCDKAGRVFSNGGRVINVVGQGKTPASAADVMYKRMARISFDGQHYRRDIGQG